MRKKDVEFHAKVGGGRFIYGGNGTPIDSPLLKSKIKILFFKI